MRIYNVEVTNYCNADCNYCPQPKMRREKGIMSMETYKKVLGVQELPVLTLHGFGDPLLHPNLLEFVRMGRERGFVVDFSTNGILLSRELMGELVESGVDEVRISIRPFFDEIAGRLDSLGEFRDRIRLLYVEYPEKRRQLPSGWKATTYSPHNWAGQVDIPSMGSGQCNPMKLRAVTVLWDGRVSNCCQDCEGDYILGTLYNGDLAPRRVKLCERCDFGR